MNLKEAFSANLVKFIVFQQCDKEIFVKAVSVHLKIQQCNILFSLYKKNDIV